MHSKVLCFFFVGHLQAIWGVSKTALWKDQQFVSWFTWGGVVRNLYHYVGLCILMSSEGHHFPNCDSLQYMIVYIYIHTYLHLYIYIISYTLYIYIESSKSGRVRWDRWDEGEAGSGMFGDDRVGRKDLDWRVVNFWAVNRLRFLGFLLGK